MMLLIRSLVFLCSALLLFAVAAAKAEQYDEYNIKAALLYNFARFVEWPRQSLPGNKHHFKICVYGNDPYGNRLDALEERNRNNITVYRHRLLKESITGCQIIFITKTTKGQVVEAISFFKNRPVLTVGETPDFVVHGGIIGLIREQDRIMFEINLAAANEAGLELSSQLLRIATRVITE